ncbi:MAG: hypothetical protein WA191_20745 [Telluria sp.]
MVTVVTAMPVPAPSRTMNQVAFDAANAARIAAEPLYTAQFNAAVAETNENAIVAAAAAASAASQVDLATAQAESASASANAAALTANAAAWVAGNYAFNASAISGLDGQTYRNYASAGVRNVDPKNDPTNWVQLGASTPTLIRSPRTANTILGVSDAATLIDITTGTFTQTFDAAATLGSGWYCYLRNSGTGNVTSLNTVLSPGTSVIVQCDGVGFTTLAVSDTAVGDTVTTLNTLSAPGWLVAGTYPQASYPILFSKLGAPPDGTVVVQRTLPAIEGWRGIAFGNGVFAGAAYSGTLTAAFSSTDGITWTARTMPVAANWSGCAFGGGVFVMVSLNSTIAASSTDGVIWTQRALPTGSGWQSVSHGNGLFVAVAAGSAIASTSADGITWTNRVLPYLGAWKRAVFGNGVWVAITTDAGTAYATSPDGINWTQRALVVSLTPTSIAFGNGIFVIVTSTTAVLTSPDGINWTQRASVISSPSALAFGAGVFFAIGGSMSARSVDGITWTSTGAGGGANTFFELAFGVGLFASPAQNVASVATFAPYSYDYTTQFKVPGLTPSAPFVTYTKGG